MPALSQTVRMAIGKHVQDDLVTPLVAADMVSLQFTNDELAKVTPINESNRDDKGKGVWATNLFKSHLEAGGPWNGRMTSESMAILSAYWAGAVTSKAPTTATGGFLYTIDEPVFTSLELPPTGMVMQMGSVLDRHLYGMVCEEFGFQLEKGPGRDNAQFTSSWKGTGQYADPSSVTMPAAYAENGLNAGGLSALTLIGFNYLNLKNFVNLNCNFKNNVRGGFFPGSGNQTGFQIEGRHRRGTPEITLSARVECESGSNEEDLVLAQTEGTGVITILGDQIDSGPESHQFKITFHRLRAKVAPISDDDGIAVYDVEYEVLEHSSNGVYTIEAITTMDEILEAAV